MIDHEKYMRLALLEARQALDNNDFPVGCVMVYDGEVIARGKRLHSQNNSHTRNNEVDHAEIIALKNLLDSQREIDLDQVAVYSTMEPCLMCYATLLVNGIKNIVYAYEDVMGGGTDLPLTKLKPLYSSMKISIVSGVLRVESLKLFQEFFGSQHNTYLQDSKLAAYTLSLK